VAFAGKQSYSNTSGSNPWDAYVYFDGNLIGHVGGATAVTDNIYCSGVVTAVSAGAHTVSVTWTYTSTAITLLNTTFSMLTTNK
jgi:hypothetical protein